MSEYKHNILCIKKHIQKAAEQCMNLVKNYLKTKMCKKNIGNNNYLGNINQKVWTYQCIQLKIKQFYIILL